MPVHSFIYYIDVKATCKTCDTFFSASCANAGVGLVHVQLHNSGMSYPAASTMTYSAC